MGKKKTTTTQQQTNTYGWQTRPETADVTALRGEVATPDPSVPFMYSKLRQTQANSFQNPLGSYSPAAQENYSRATYQSFAMNEAQAINEARYAADNTNFARKSAIAEMTNPVLTQTGGSSTGTQTQSGGFWGDLLKSGLNTGVSLM